MKINNEEEASVEIFSTETTKKGRGEGEEGRLNPRMPPATLQLFLLRHRKVFYFEKSVHVFMRF